MNTDKVYYYKRTEVVETTTLSTDGDSLLAPAPTQLGLRSTAAAPIAPQVRPTMRPRPKPRMPPPSEPQIPTPTSTTALRSVVSSYRSTVTESVVSRSPGHGALGAVKPESSAPKPVPPPKKDGASAKPETVAPSPSRPPVERPKAPSCADLYLMSVPAADKLAECLRGLELVSRSKSSVLCKQAACACSLVQMLARHCIILYTNKDAVESWKCGCEPGTLVRIYDYERTKDVRAKYEIKVGLESNGQVMVCVHPTEPKPQGRRGEANAYPTKSATGAPKPNTHEGTPTKAKKALLPWDSVSQEALPSQSTVALRTPEPVVEGALVPVRRKTLGQVSFS